MHHQEFEPPEALREAIKCFWYNSWGPAELQSGFEVQPDGYAEIIFHFGTGCSIANGGDLLSLPSPFMMGLQNQPVIFHAKNRLEIIGIRCYPWTVFDLLGLPASKGGIRILEHPNAKLQSALNKLIDAGSIDEAMAEVKQYFLNERRRVADAGMLSKAGAAMREANGALPVSQVAAVAHATVRTLERKFKLAAGFSVKDVSALIRFEQVRNQLWLNPYANLAALAHELGYTDQSHLSREFKRYSGTTPAAFARRAKKDKPVVSNNFVGFIPA